MKLNHGARCWFPGFMKYISFELWIERESKERFRAVIDDFLTDVCTFMSNRSFGQTAYCDYHEKGEGAFQIGLEFVRDQLADGITSTARYIHEKYPDLRWRMQVDRWDESMNPPED